MIDGPVGGGNNNERGRVEGVCVRGGGIRGEKRVRGMFGEW